MSFVKKPLLAPLELTVEADERVEKLEQLVRTLQRTIDDLTVRLDAPAAEQPSGKKRKKK